LPSATDRPVFLSDEDFHLIVGAYSQAHSSYAFGVYGPFILHRLPDFQFRSPAPSHQSPISSHGDSRLALPGATGAPGVFTAAAALAAQRPLRDIQSDLEERPLLEAHPRLSPTVQSFAPARLDRRLPRSA
jgi:hypothetical protein